MQAVADEIAFLGACLQGTDIELLELATQQAVVLLRRDRAGEAYTQAPPASTAPFEITAPSVGVFLRAHPLQTAPLAQAGQLLSPGDPVGVLQIGALLVHVTAPKDGIVLEILAEDGAAVGYGTALVRVMGDGGQ
jgi:acetyl-CoA carboxylase biotin carboxyl carrier protein